MTDMDKILAIYEIVRTGHQEYAHWLKKRMTLQGLDSYKEDPRNVFLDYTQYISESKNNYAFNCGVDAWFKDFTESFGNLSLLGGVVSHEVKVDMFEAYLTCSMITLMNCDVVLNKVKQILNA